MFVCLFRRYALLELLLFSTLPQQIMAREPLNPISLAVFSNSFNLYDLTGKGGCNRNAPNGVPMLQRSLTTLGGAWALSRTVTDELPNYYSQTYIRGLLFLFFGITFQENNELNPDVNNVNAFNHIADTYAQVNKVFTNPGSNTYNLRPRYRCLEDYANYYTHMLGSDGQEDTSEPLIGEYFDYKTEGGYTRPPPYNDIWPGLMFVYNADDRSDGWYPPHPANPPTGCCYSAPDRTITAFTDAEFDLSTPNSAGLAKALFGITKCASHFNSPTLSSLGIPTRNGGIAEILRFQKAADLEDLHEAMHLISAGGIIDQPAVVPPESNPLDPNVWLTNRNYALWSVSPTERTYGYKLTSFLGLVAPLAARLNADSFVIFALCMYFPELDCLGAFQYDMRKKRSSVTAGLLSEKAMRRIREGKFDLTRDVPLDRDLKRRGGKGGSEKKEGGRRFRDEDGPEMMVG